MIYIDIEKKLHGSSGEMHMALKLAIQEGEFIALSGKSGSGKTTLLRILAGLEEARGTIMIGEEVWLDAKQSLPPQKRGIGFVFQEYALFPNMSILENLLFVNRDKKLATYLLEMTELSGLSKRFPTTLSGGQQQRVSLCRALMNRPKLLLMDEPLSALDSVMRHKLQHEILTLHKEFGTTTIMVSHDVGEIYRLSQRVVVLENGKIIDDGVAKDILLKEGKSQKLTLRGEILEIIKRDTMPIALILIAQQIIEVALCKEEAESLRVGDTIDVSTTSFKPEMRANYT